MSDEQEHQDAQPKTTPNGTRIVAIKADGTQVDVTNQVGATYDLVLGSMDWGSGFLTVEDALPIADLSEICGYSDHADVVKYIEEERRNEEVQRQREEAVRRREQERTGPLVTFVSTAAGAITGRTFLNLESGEPLIRYEDVEPE